MFARRDYVQGGISHRGMVTFTPWISLQYFTQYLVVQGTYEDYHLLQDDGYLQPVSEPYAASGYSLERLNYQFFQANARLRWEYRPGSVAFLVWTQSRYLGGPAGIDEAFQNGSNNALVFKLSYRWGAEDRRPEFRLARWFKGEATAATSNRSL